ncbi:Threonine/homoserine/homoserine lactone efflux protein [Lutibacter oricola]|uniref:Threonine/homoserine/homoserine lactone efflux protein n=2 Tax=Lutibacter oricola TaxID=762486 RepID=A0A1H2X270_9FLAO|nr:Threonine/homoserine/homoserine lactone efflux protein [Lutibacter oricola]
MPGPDIIYVLVQSISNGKKYGIVTALGLVSGILLHTTLVAFGVSAIINQSQYLFLGLKIIGAIYLVYLAYTTFLNSEEIKIGEASPKKGVFKLFKQGFIMNVINPKVSIFFLAFFPGFLYSTTQNTITQFFVLGGIFMVQAFIIFSMVAILSGYFSNYIKTHPKFNSTIKWFKIVVFLGIALFILFS